MSSTWTKARPDEPDVQGIHVSVTVLIGGIAVRVAIARRAPEADQDKARVQGIHDSVPGAPRLASPSDGGGSDQSSLVTK